MESVRTRRHAIYREAIQVGIGAPLVLHRYPARSAGDCLGPGPGGLDFRAVPPAAADQAGRGVHDAVAQRRLYLPDRGVLDNHDGVGFCPEAVALVPRNDLDERYAYFLLSKPR